MKINVIKTIVLCVILISLLNGQHYSIELKQNTNIDYNIELPRISASQPQIYDSKHYFFKDSALISNYYELHFSDDFSYISIIQTNSDDFYIDKNIDRICSEDEIIDFKEDGYFLTAIIQFNTNYPLQSVIGLKKIIGQNLILRQLNGFYSGILELWGKKYDVFLISNPNNLSLLNKDQLLIGFDFDNNKNLSSSEIVRFNDPVKINGKAIVAEDINIDNGILKLILNESSKEIALGIGFFHPNLTICSVKDFNYHDIIEFQGKIVVFNWWSTSCGPCLLEIPELNKLKTEFENNEFLEFIALNSTNSNPQIENFLSQNEFTFEQYSVDKKDAKNLGINSIPRTIIIDEDGKIIYDQVGYNTEQGVSKIKKIIEQVL